MTDLNRRLEGQQSLLKLVFPSKEESGNGDVRRIAMKRIMKILGIAGIVALLSSGGAVLPAAATPEVTVSIDAPVQAAPGSDFTANVNISEVVDFDACNYDVSFDVSVLRLDSVTSGLVGSTAIPVDIYNEISSGTYRVVQNVPELPGVSGSGYLAVLHFHIVGSAGSSSLISPSKGVLSDNTASEITAAWSEDSVVVAAAASEDTPPPPVVNSVPEAATASEDTTPPTEDNSPPEAVALDEEAVPLPTKPINWPVLLGVIEGIIVLGLIIFLLARRKAY